jgi:exodeoxyribonuclease V beta subunit
VPEDRFDLLGPLPGPGITVVEASAGTGKTFTVAGLVARYVAEGIATLPNILAVTFTRAATGELKERVRSRLASAELALAQMIETGAPPPEEDELLCFLADRAGAGRTASAEAIAAPAARAARAAGDAPAPSGATAGAELHRRRRRLAEALANFDSATIATTHGFCYMVLGALGVWGEFSPGVTLLEDPKDLVEEVVDDLYARWIAKLGSLPFSPKDAAKIGLEAVRNFATDLDPPADETDLSAGGLRRRLAKGVRAEVSRRLIEANRVTYDGMLSRLRDALADPERGEGAWRRLAARYRIVLVDEFQDTDFVQWEVVRRAFARGGVRVVLVGDPKQAIYAFRGADVHAYLAAARTAGPANRFTLERNWRSDSCLTAACDALFYPLQLGHPEIVYRPAAASCEFKGQGVRGAPVAQPLRLRWLDRTGTGHRASKPFPKARATALVAEDLAADLVSLLASDAVLPERTTTRSSGAPEPDTSGQRLRRQARPLEPGDVAVLVRTNDQAITVQSALLDAGIPAVVSSARSVMTTRGAREWLVLLDALQQPASRSPAAAAALGDFLGRRAEDLSIGDERIWEAVHERLHKWSSVLRRSGVAALFAEVCASEALPRRLLAEVQGERRLTDLAHVAELLHAEAKRSQLGPPALRAWLARRIEESESDSNEEEAHCRRLDSDREAVQILTVHRAKGLEFPVVYCPYFWDAGKSPHFGDPIAFHKVDGVRKLDVGAAREPSYKEHFELLQGESLGEDLRQLYVALTRAKHQLVLWWVPATNSQRSPLGRILFSGRRPDGGLVDPRASEPRDVDVESALEHLQARAPDLINIEKPKPNPTKAPGSPRPAPRPGPLTAMPFDRQVDTAWGRLSYSSITSRAYALGAQGGALGDSQQLVGSEPEDPGTGDEPRLVAAVARPPTSSETSGSPRVGPPVDGALAQGPGGWERQARSIGSPWSAVPAGTAVGTFVHRVLQMVDFSAPELSKALSETVGAWIRTYPGDPTDAATLVEALEATITTPLGAMAGGISLRDVNRADRLDELSFELPVAGGDKPVGRLNVADLAPVLSDHLAGDDPLRAYIEALASPLLDSELRGYLNGSLDLVFRSRSASESRYFVVDYKTSWLAPAGEALSTWHYRFAALEAEMRHANYLLQALLYLVALHRYLRWRLPGYRPEVHLGGVLYLFVRGMTGPGVPIVDGYPCGVFSWPVPPGLVTDLSDLLATGNGTTPWPGRRDGNP